MVHTLSAGGSDCRYLGRLGLVISEGRCAKTKRTAGRAEDALWTRQVETECRYASGHTLNFPNRFAGIKICDSTSSPGETNVSLEDHGNRDSMVCTCIAHIFGESCTAADGISKRTQTERTSRSGRERNSGPEERRPDLQGNEVSPHWTVSRRAIIDRVRYTRRSNHLLFRRDRGRRLEIHGWRHDLDFGLR